MTVEASIASGSAASVRDIATVNGPTAVLRIDAQ